jgi:DNA-binding MarR family transcriptional regulator
MSYANDMTRTIEQVARTDSGLASALRISVARLSRRLRSERDPDNELLPVGQLSVLGTLFRKGPSTIGQLAAEERVQPPSVTRTVNCLVDGGYVVRRPHETDGRQVVVALSAQGEETLAADRKRRDVWLAQRLRELTPEERHVLRQAAPLIERLAHM